MRERVREIKCVREIAREKGNKIEQERERERERPSNSKREQERGRVCASVRDSR